MGTLASKPVTTKDTETGRVLGLPYAACGMQGWRRGMEDAHVVASVDVDGRALAIVGVFDGHGGRGVARYVASHMSDVFREKLVVDGDEKSWLEKGLATTFETLDESMRTQDGRNEIKIFECGSEPPKDVLKQKTGTPGLPRPNMGRKHSTVGGAVFSEGGTGLAEAVEKAADGGGVEDLDGAIEDATGASPGPNFLADMLQSHATPEGMGATAVVCAVLPPKSGGIAGSTLVCANAGDSRAVLCRGGKAVTLSEDHKPDDEGERKRIYAAGGHVRNGRVCDNLNLSRALGDFSYKDFAMPAAERVISGVPDFMSIELTAEDEFLVLGCDGIYEKSSRQEVVDFVRERVGDPKPNEMPDLERVACEYLDHALCEDLSNPDFDGSGCDNMTLVIVRLNPPDRVF